MSKPMGAIKGWSELSFKSLAVPLAAPIKQTVIFASPQIINIMTIMTSILSTKDFILIMLTAPTDELVKRLLFATPKTIMFLDIAINIIITPIAILV